MKIAVVLFVSTPLLGQAGLSVEDNQEKALQLYSVYIEELLSLFSTHPEINVFFCCEEKFQAVMVSNHFARIKNCLVYSGNWGKRLAEITHYCGDYQDYDFIFLCPQEFTLITPTDIANHLKTLQRNKRSVLLISHDQKTLDVIAVNFPFQNIYQDIIWQKDNVIEQIKANLHQQSIPCTTITKEIVLHSSNQDVQELTSFFPRTCAILHTHQ